MPDQRRLCLQLRQNLFRMVCMAGRNLPCRQPKPVHIQTAKFGDMLVMHLAIERRQTRIFSPGMLKTRAPPCLLKPTRPCLTGRSRLTQLNHQSAQTKVIQLGFNAP